MPGEAFSEGVRRLQMNDFAGAISYFQDATRETPEDGRIYGYLGMAYSRIGDRTNSVLALETATRLLPSDAGAFYNLAVALLQADRPLEARRALEQSLSLDPNNQRAQAAWNSLGADLSGNASVFPTSTGVGEFHVSQPSNDATIPTVPPLEIPPTIPARPDFGAPAAPEMVGGMAYNPNLTGTSAPQPVAFLPSVGQRIVRGLGYGAMFGQWWTLLIVVFGFILHGGGLQHPLGLLIVSLLFALVFAFVGALLGLIIAVANLDENKGMVVGIVFGLLMLGIEFLLAKGSSAIFINIFFWTFTGRFVGRNTAIHVQKLVLPK